MEEVIKESDDDRADEDTPHWKSTSCRKEICQQVRDAQKGGKHNFSTNARQNVQEVVCESVHFYRVAQPLSQSTTKIAVGHDDFCIGCSGSRQLTMLMLILVHNLRTGELKSNTQQM